MVDGFIDQSLLEEIQDLNLSYLILAKRMLVDDYTSARFRLKLDDAMAKQVMALTAKQMNRLARTNQFLFRLNLESTEQLEKLFSGKRELNIESTHAAVMLASNEEGNID